VAAPTDGSKRPFALLGFVKRRKYLLCLVVALLTIGIALIVPGVTEAALARSISKVTGSPASIVIERVRPTRASFRDLRIGEGDRALTVAAGDLAFTPSGLRQGTIQAASLSGVRLTCEVTQDGFNVAGLDKLIAEPADPSSQLPFSNRISIRQSTVLIRADDFELVIPFELEVLNNGGALVLESTASLGAGSARITAVIEPATQTADLVVNANTIDLDALPVFLRAIGLREPFFESSGGADLKIEAIFKDGAPLAFDLSATGRRWGLSHTGLPLGDDRTLSTEASLNDCILKMEGKLRDHADLKTSLTASSATVKAREPEAGTNYLAEFAELDWTGSAKIGADLTIDGVLKSVRTQLELESTKLQRLRCQVHGSTIQAKLALNAESDLPAGEVHGHASGLAVSLREERGSSMEQLRVSDLSWKLTSTPGKEGLPIWATVNCDKLTAQFDRVISEQEAAGNAKLDSLALSLGSDGHGISDLSLNCASVTIDAQVSNNTGQVMAKRIDLRLPLHRRDKAEWWSNPQLKVERLDASCVAPILATHDLDVEQTVYLKSLELRPLESVEKSQLAHLGINSEELGIVSGNGKVSADSFTGHLILEPKSLDLYDLDATVAGLRIHKDSLELGPTIVEMAMQSNQASAKISPTKIRWQDVAGTVGLQVSANDFKNAEKLRFDARIDGSGWQLPGDYVVPKFSISAKGSRRTCQVSVGGLAITNMPDLKLDHAQFTLIGMDETPAISQGHASLILNPNSRPKLGSKPLTSSVNFSATNLTNLEKLTYELTARLPEQRVDGPFIENARFAGDVSMTLKAHGTLDHFEGNLATTLNEASATFRDIGVTELTANLNGNYERVEIATLRKALDAGQLSLATLPGFSGKLTANADATHGQDLELSGFHLELPIEVSPADTTVDTPPELDGTFRIKEIHASQLKVTDVAAACGLNLHSWRSDGSFLHGDLKAIFSQSLSWRDDLEASATATFKEQPLTSLAQWHLAAPAFADLEVDGVFAATANVAYRKGRLSANTSSVLRDLTVKHGPQDTEIRGINTKIEVPDLLALRTAPIHLEFELITVGEEQYGPGAIDLRLDGPEALTLQKAKLHSYGGLLMAGPTTFDPKKLTLSLDVICENIDLGMLATKIPGFEGKASGRLYGRVPLSFEKGAFTGGSGFLYSIPGESDKLEIDDLPILFEALAEHPKSDQIKAALKDFAYSSLTMQFAAPPGDTARMQSRIRGRDKEGREYEFRPNVNIPDFDLGAVFEFVKPLKDALSN
jgi:hypothetical protein